MKRNALPKRAPKKTAGVARKLASKNRAFPVIAMAASVGVQIIKDKGGKVIAQDRPTSQDFSMPETSIQTDDVDFILPLDEIAPKLIELVGAGGKLNPISKMAMNGQRRAAPGQAEFATPHYSTGTKAAMLQRK